MRSRSSRPDEVDGDDVDIELLMIALGHGLILDRHGLGHGLGHVGTNRDADDSDIPSVLRDVRSR